jgi:hypothetical protein
MSALEADHPRSPSPLTLGQGEGAYLKWPANENLRQDRLQSARVSKAMLVRHAGGRR